MGQVTRGRWLGQVVGDRWLATGTGGMVTSERINIQIYTYVCNILYTHW